MKIKSLITILLPIILLTGCNSQTENYQSSQQNSWKEIEKDLEYKEVNITTDPGENPQGYKNLLLIKINPKKFSFSIYENKDKEKAKTIKEIHQENDSLLTFNGQFFTEDFKPTGLLISEEKMLHSQSNANLMNGIIGIGEAGSVIFSDAPISGTSEDLNEKQFVFAIQNGPILLDQNGEIKIKTDSGVTASRTAIGIDKDENIVLIILKQSLLNFDNSISLYLLAHLLKESSQLQELKLHSVLNLDGGTSTGLMIDDKYYPEMEKVQNVILVKKRQTGV